MNVSRDPGSWEQFFDAYAPRYMSESFVTATVAEADFIERELQLRPGAAILDLGCGTGRHSIELARRGYRMTGVDLSAGMLAEARKAAESASMGVTWIRADATIFRSDQSFDAALCLCEGSLGLLGAGDDPLEHDLAVLGTMAHALRPGGRFMLTVLNAFRFARAAPAPTAEEAGPEAGAAGAHVDMPEAPLGSFDPATSSAGSVMSWTDGETEHSIAVRERSFIPTELALLCRVAGLDVDWVGGGTAGSWGRRPLGLDEFEIMVLGRSPGES